MLTDIHNQYMKWIASVGEVRFEEIQIPSENGQLLALRLAPQQPCRRLCVFISGLGLDHADFFPFFSTLAARNAASNSNLLALTAPGFEQTAEPSNAPCTLDELGNKLATAIEAQWHDLERPDLHLFGFSVGADLVMQMIPKLVEATGGKLRSVYLADLNVCRESCFLSSRIAMNIPARETIIAALHADVASNPEIAADICTYFATILRKPNWDTLCAVAEDVVKHSNSRFKAFAAWVRKTPLTIQITLGFSSAADENSARSELDGGIVMFDEKIFSHFRFLDATKLQSIFDGFENFSPH
jgi:pimeloyl-ACP methyl ester carboxylesterase